MQCIVLFSVIQTYVCYVGSVLHHKGTKQMKMPTVSFDCLHLYWPNSVEGLLSVIILSPNLKKRSHGKSIFAEFTHFT